MTAADTEVVLGRPHIRVSPDEEPRHRLMYLPDRDTVVMPFCRSTRDGWHCVVVASRDQRPGGQLTLTDAQVAAARPTMPYFTDAETFAKLVWPSQVFRCWPGGAELDVARVLARELRRPGTCDVPVAAFDDHALIARRLSPVQPGHVRAALARLVTAGYVTPPTDGLRRLMLPPSTEWR